MKFVKSYNNRYYLETKNTALSVNINMWSYGIGLRIKPVTLLEIFCIYFNFNLIFVEIVINIPLYKVKDLGI